MSKSVLLVGGYGTLGAQLARTLRHRNPDLPLTIAGRSLDKAESLASELGGASAAVLNIGADNGLPLGDFSVIVLLVKDETLRFTDLAGRNGIPLLSLSSGAFEIGPEAVHGLHAAKHAPIVLASHWFAGAPAIITLDLASQLQSVELIELGVVIDTSDVGGGPATIADFQRIAGACPSTLIRRDGRYEWVRGEAARAEFEREDGSRIEGTIAVSYDVLSLAAATGARTVRVVQAFSHSLSAKRGEGPADEISIRVAG